VILFPTLHKVHCEGPKVYPVVFPNNEPSVLVYPKCMDGPVLMLGATKISRLKISEKGTNLHNSAPATANQPTTKELIHIG